VRRIRKAFLCVFAVVILVSGLKVHDRPVLSRSPFSEEQLSVYRGVLDMLSLLHFRNLSTVSVPFDFTGFLENRPCLDGIELENVPEAQRTIHGSGPEITKARELKLVDRYEQTKLLKQRAAASTVPTKSRQAGSELNFLVRSEVVFDKKHKFAVVKYLSICGEHCASGTTRVMEKVDGKWVASSRPVCAGLIGY
jgi:hypothetical protein